MKRQSNCQEAFAAANALQLPTLAIVIVLVLGALLLDRCDHEQEHDYEKG